MISFLEYLNAKLIEKKLFNEIGDFKIFLVSATKIRDSSQENDEFNHIGTHLGFPKLIPNNEIWISNDISKHEQSFLIHNGISQYKAKNKRDWYEYALKLEKIERAKVDGFKFRGRYSKKAPPDKLYDKLYCQIGNIKVWLVDGEIVRDLYKTDFIEGGNSQVYCFVPKNEIWIEKNLDKREINATILHEYTESVFMKCKNKSYNEAHTIASKVEWNHRKCWTKNDTIALTKSKVLNMAKSTYRGQDE